MIVGIYKMHDKQIYIENQVFDYYDNLIRAKILESKNVVIDGKIYKDFVVDFTRYNWEKTITMFSLYYRKLMGKIKEHEGNSYLIVEDYVLDKVLDSIKNISGIEKCLRLLIDTDDILAK